LDTDRYELKFAALDRLSRFNSDEALDGLKKAMTTRGDEFGKTSSHSQLAENIRHSASVALSRSPHPDARPLLLTMWDDPNTGVKITVLHALGKMDSPESLDLLKKMSADRDERVRNEALRYLELRGISENEAESKD
jgi:HEAT repeats